MLVIDPTGPFRVLLPGKQTPQLSSLLLVGTHKPLSPSMQPNCQAAWVLAFMPPAHFEGPCWYYSRRRIGSVTKRHNRQLRQQQIKLTNALHCCETTSDIMRECLLFVTFSSPLYWFWLALHLLPAHYQTAQNAGDSSMDLVTRRAVQSYYWLRLKGVY